MTKLVTVAQIKALIDFLEEHPDVACGKINRTTEGRGESKKYWIQFAKTANSVDPNGVKKSPQAWRTYYAEYKCKLHKKIRLLKADYLTGKSRTMPLSESQVRLYHILGENFGDVLPGVPQIDVEPTAEESLIDISTEIPNLSQYVPKAREIQSRESQIKSKNFNIVKKCCLELIQMGRPAELMDDGPFQKLLTLIPLFDGDRQLICSEFVMSLEGADDGDDDDGVEDPMDNVEAYIEPENESMQDHNYDHSFKEVVKVEHRECTCPSGANTDNTKHVVTCPIASEQPYWNYFDLTMDSGRCTICQLNIQWTQITDLKDHLNTKHPFAKYKDDDDIDFEIQQTDHEKVSQVFIPLDPKQDERPTKKRKRDTCVTLNDSNEVPLSKFNGLDRFGLYVSSLLSTLPREKCIKYQSQFVNKLLQELAAAG